MFLRQRPPADAIDQPTSELRAYRIVGAKLHTIGVERFEYMRLPEYLYARDRLLNGHIG